MGGENVTGELYCEKCNITFKKLEVFKVHKENYCESRHANVEAIQAARAEKQREREEMKLVNKVCNSLTLAASAIDQKTHEPDSTPVRISVYITFVH